MRLDAAQVVARDAGVAQLHALLLARGARLQPRARGWLLRDHRLRVRLVWRDRLLQTSHVTMVTLPLGVLPA